jgi:hypothetical protein
MKNICFYALMGLWSLTAYAMEQQDHPIERSESFSFLDLNAAPEFEVKQSTIAQPKSMKEQLEELLKNPKCHLAGVERKLIVLLSTHDLERLLSLLDKDILGTQKEHLRHIIFLKYLISHFSQETYSDARIARRLSIYTQLLKKSQHTPDESTWLEQHKRLDDLLSSQEHQTIPAEINGHFLGALIDLAACLSMDPPLLLTDPKADIERFKGAAWYYGYDYMTALSSSYKSILYETIVTLIRIYSKNDMDIVTKGITERTQFLRKEIRHLSRRDVQNAHSYETEDTDTISIGALLNTLNAADIKRLFYLSVHPFFSPNATRDAFTLKFIATNNPYAQSDTDSVKNIKKLLLKVLSFNQPSRAPYDKVSLCAFMKDLEKALQDGKVTNLSSSLLRYAKDIKNMPSERKKAFTAFGNFVHSQYCVENQEKEEKEAELSFAQKRKHNQISTQESLSTEGLAIASTIFTLLKNVDNQSHAPLLRHLLTQSPFKEMLASREDQYNETIQTLETKRTQLIAHNNQLTLEKSALWENAEQANEYNAQMQKAYTVFSQEAAEKIGAAQQQLKAQGEINAKLSQELATLQQEHNACGSAQLSLGAQIELLQQKLTTEQANNNVLSLQLAVLQEMNTLLKQEKQSTLSQLNSLQQELTAQQETAAQLSNQVSEIKKAHTNFKRACTTFNKTFSKK